MPSVGFQLNQLLGLSLTCQIGDFKSKFSNVAFANCGALLRSILGPLLFLIYINDTFQALDYDLFFYAGGSCLVYQHKHVKETDQALNKSFLNVCDWTVNNKLSTHFGEDKTKSIMFVTKRKVTQWTF